MSYVHESIPIFFDKGHQVDTQKAQATLFHQGKVGLGHGKGGREGLKEASFWGSASDGGGFLLVADGLRSWGYGFLPVHSTTVCSAVLFLAADGSIFVVFPFARHFTYPGFGHCFCPERSSGTDKMLLFPHIKLVSTKLCKYLQSSNDANMIGKQTSTETS